MNKHVYLFIGFVVFSSTALHAVRLVQGGQTTFCLKKRSDALCIKQCKGQKFNALPVTIKGAPSCKKTEYVCTCVKPVAEEDILGGEKEETVLIGTTEASLPSRSKRFTLAVERPTGLALTTRTEKVTSPGDDFFTFEKETVS